MHIFRKSNFSRSMFKGVENEIYLQKVSCTTSQRRTLGCPKWNEGQNDVGVWEKLSRHTSCRSWSCCVEQLLKLLLELLLLLIFCIFWLTRTKACCYCSCRYFCYHVCSTSIGSSNIGSSRSSSSNCCSTHYLRFKNNKWHIEIVHTYPPLPSQWGAGKVPFKFSGRAPSAERFENSRPDDLSSRKGWAQRFVHQRVHSMYISGFTSISGTTLLQLS